MTKAEKKQLVDIFLEIESLIHIIDQNLPTVEDVAGGRENIDFSGLTIDKVMDLLALLRVHVKYQAFDVEACRRDIEFLNRMIQTNGNQG